MTRVLTGWNAGHQGQAYIAAPVHECAYVFASRDATELPEGVSRQLLGITKGGLELTLAENGCWVDV